MRVSLVTYRLLPHSLWTDVTTVRVHASSDTWAQSSCKTQVTHACVQTGHNTPYDLVCNLTPIVITRSALETCIDTQVASAVQEDGLATFMTQLDRGLDPSNIRPPVPIISASYNRHQSQDLLHRWLQLCKRMAWPPS